eukprot:CAMPEP_0178845950 /NCGR_PEP_ID=MMETSP0746-20121128/17743_1 /TAXON_ID=913974 /ORGANISM="Nitzschia punctata, Strain CCMP561" /LENGTH=210 /DNA_ID=CAMNT_0020510245 /DNA_START=60 /DNA_END=688 /DNA_ORIENTATION=-
MDALADWIEFVVEQHPPVVVQSKYDHQLHLHVQQDNCRDTFTMVSPARFQQTRYIMGVPDEESFRANITHQQLYTIENKELGTILEELASAIALQRYRFFVDRQQEQEEAGKNHNLRHSLARIVTDICRGYSKVVSGMMRMEGYATTTATTFHTTNKSVFQQCIPGPGCLELLSKCASHPSVVIRSIVLPIVTPVLASEIGLATQWLPIL